MWARTGNVNLTASTTVNGGSISPTFLSNGIKPGYSFQGPDGRQYEITAVNSETQLSLFNAYAGTPATNQSYAIMQNTAAAYSAQQAQIDALLTEFSTVVEATSAKFGAPTETGAVLAALGALVSHENSASVRNYISKGAIANDASLEFAVAKSGRARLGLIGNNNVVLQYSSNGSTWTPVWTVDVTNGRFSWNLPTVPTSYTIATLPATHAAGSVVYVTDLGGGAGLLVSDGTGWKRQYPGYATDASILDHTHTELVDAGKIRLTGTLAANRLLTLSTTNARAGAQRRYTRTGGGIFTWSIGGLKTLSLSQWCEVTYDGSSWYLSAYGAL